jgi:hypothetical protein
MFGVDMEHIITVFKNIENAQDFFCPTFALVHIPQLG